MNESDYLKPLTAAYEAPGRRKWRGIMGAGYAISGSFFFERLLLTRLTVLSQGCIE